MHEQCKRIQWVVQRNLTHRSDFEQLKEACNSINVGFIEVDIVPFSEKLPEFDRSRSSIIYGSTTFTSLALKDPLLKKGLFFDETTFSIENYIDRWGRYLLNYGAFILTLEDLIHSNKYNYDKLLFIRPNDDNKSFAGEVKRFDEIRDWYEKLKKAGNTSLSLESKVVVSEPYNIQYEWRLWIVNKKVVAASMYREYFRLRKEEGCPKEVIAFVEERCLQYTPHDVFVMDICLCGNEYFIVECGCMNGAGFYKAKITDIVESVTSYFTALP